MIISQLLFVLEKKKWFKWFRRRIDELYGDITVAQSIHIQHIHMALPSERTEKNELCLDLTICVSLYFNSSTILG